MARHNYTYLLEYIPVRYQGLSAKQLQDRKDIFNFKDGSAPLSVKNGLLSKIRNIVANNPSQWIVCFIPASTKTKTYNRFSSLALYLSREAGCDVFIDAIVNSVDTEAGHISGKSNNPTQNFIINSSYIRDKNVILIDDVITRGRTFDDSADKLLKAGATSVQGLFVAKTIHPDLPQVSKTSRSYHPEYDIFDEMYEDELAAEIAAEEAYQEAMLDELAAEQAYEDEMIADCYDCYEDYY